MFLAACGACVAAAGDETGWLSVTDFGASGSTFDTKATLTAGSKDIVVEDVGDFKVGQGVMISRGDPRYYSGRVYGPGRIYYGSQPLKGKFEIRGFDGTKISWVGFVLDIRKANPVRFRWTDDLARTWKAHDVPITGDWQPLSNGVEVKFLKYDWQPGHVIAFGAQSQVLSVIDKIEGKTITLRTEPKAAAKHAVICHDDQPGLRAAIDAAIRDRKNVYLPQGHYRLSKGVGVRNAAIRIEGSGMHTVLDISCGRGSVFGLHRGKSVTIRSLKMVGPCGFADRAGVVHTATGNGFWTVALQPSGAVYVGGVERLLVEDVHVSKMTSECFYSGGSFRDNVKRNRPYTQSITYHRVTVTDCGFNAFNNNDLAENTNILNCRVVDIGGAFWEGPSRFIRFVGNYVRNTDGFSIGNQSTRHQHGLDQLGCGQAIVADNVLEGVRRSDGIRVAHGPTQAVIANNLFINFNANAIRVSSDTWHSAYAASNVVVKGNIIDLTNTSDEPRSRTGIYVSASDTIVADNQVYVRGEIDPRTTGIAVVEPAQNVNVHDNLVRNCGRGIITGSTLSTVGKVVDESTFVPGRFPFQWRHSHCYRGWHLAWLSGVNNRKLARIDVYTPDEETLKLAQPHRAKVGDRFNVFAALANWQIHHNTVTGCRSPVVLGGYGSATSCFVDNTVTRGQAGSVKEAIAVQGRFRLLRNHIQGFDEPGCCALAPRPDPIARTPRSEYSDNVFESCGEIVAETCKGLWEASSARGNVFIDCGKAPKQAVAPAKRDGLAAVLIEPAKRPTLTAAKVARPPRVDGEVSEWPWQDAGRVVAIAQTPMGDALGKPAGRACAARDAENLYLAVRISVHAGARLRGGEDFASCDGVEVSFQDPEVKARAPIFVLWGSSDGTMKCLPNGGASPAQVQRVQAAVMFASRVGQSEWTCEWRIPLAAAGIDPKTAKALLFNIGAHVTAQKLWVGWVGTQSAFFHVGNAGELVLAK